MSSGISPTILKTGIVSPVYQKRTQQLFDDYRPISSKLHNKNIYKRMYNAKNILYDKQFGFRKNHNTTDAILLIILNWNTLDLSKAFYTICHKELLVKLENYGIRGNCLNLIKNYLRNRNQMT